MKARNLQESFSKCIAILRCSLIFLKKAFDKMPFFVVISVLRINWIRLRRNAEISVMVGNVFTVSPFCKNSTARNIELFKANLKHDSIMYMSACKLQYKMVSESIHYRVDFAWSSSSTDYDMLMIIISQSPFLHRHLTDALWYKFRLYTDSAYSYSHGHFQITVWAFRLSATIVDPNSQPQLKNLSWKWKLMKIRESRRIRKWKEEFGEETETSRGWLSRRLF